MQGSIKFTRPTGLQTVGDPAVHTLSPGDAKRRRKISEPLCDEDRRRLASPDGVGKGIKEGAILIGVRPRSEEDLASYNECWGFAITRGIGSLIGGFASFQPKDLEVADTPFGAEAKAVLRAPALPASGSSVGPNNSRRLGLC